MQCAAHHINRVVHFGYFALDKKSNVVSKIKEAAKPAITEKQMAQAKDYIVAGGDVEAIKTKYKLTAKQEKELNGQKADTAKTS